MRIKDSSSLSELKKRTKSTSVFTNVTSKLFSEELCNKQINVHSYEKDVDKLRIEIEYAGDKLENEPILANFQNFRNLLSKLSKLITAEAYQLEKIGGTPSNPRYYEIITIINTEADKLYNLILNEQRNHMAITAKVIGIKGLVVDLIT